MEVYLHPNGPRWRVVRVAGRPLSATTTPYSSSSSPHNLLACKLAPVERAHHKLGRLPFYASSSGVQVCSSRSCGARRCSASSDETPAESLHDGCLSCHASRSRYTVSHDLEAAPVSVERRYRSQPSAPSRVGAGHCPSRRHWRSRRGRHRRRGRSGPRRADSRPRQAARRRAAPISCASFDGKGGEEGPPVARRSSRNRLSRKGAQRRPRIPST